MCILRRKLCRIVLFTILLYELIIYIEGHNFPDIRQAEFVRHLMHYDVAYPIRVTADGHYLTHHVHYRYRRSSSQTHSRYAEKDTLHYKITLDNSEVHLRLHRNDKFLAPGFVVERWGNLYKNVSDSFIRRRNDNLCHFQGKSLIHSLSRVALSTCDGLTGIIGLDHEDYFIEPIRGHNFSEDSSHPHLVYKRSALPPEYGIQIPEVKTKASHGSCGVKDDEDYDKIIAQRERWEKNSHNKSVKRKKRSISAERNVETLIVVDKKMLDYYADQDVETYVLTVMNMVSTLFHDASLGNIVNVILVRLIISEHDQKELRVDHHADNTLKGFCQWQRSINPNSDAHPNHHDVAVLLTRYNICTRMNEPCNTLGLAEVSGMCQPHRSCNINEDTGLALAFTIAHEMGHNFGMKHDSPHNGCLPRHGELQHVMAPHLNSVVSPLIWSNCSRGEITKFLDRDWGECLDDEPRDHKFQYPVLPPGAMYDADHQCRLQYGPEASHCEGIENICSALWCKVNNRCLTRLEPPAEGTQCGKHKWCSNGKCSTMGERPDAINGAWGEWSEWSGCSRTCGAGVSYIERHCDHPAPSNGGRFCIGERKRYKVCNTEACPEGSPSFRELQCASYNNKTYRHQLYKWEPVSTPGFPCQLYCKPLGEFFSVMLSDTVLDGTPCPPGSRDMCINGKCMKVGCDWGIESAAKEDRCGICHGDGSSCTTVKEEFMEKQGLGYVEATVIPKGARNIKVEEKEAAGNYLAIRGEDGNYYLNGHWFIQWSGDYDVAGTTIQYRRSGNKETVSAPGPLKENLHIMLLFQTHNPGIISEYTIPNQNATREPEFSWEFMDWTRCTVSCGGGKQRSSVYCAEKEAGPLDDIFCDISSKPDDKLRDCNMHQCPARWWSGPWQHCSVTCGNLGIRKRTVICVRALGADEQIALNDLDCENQEKPVDMEPCPHMQACPPGSLWKTGEWSNTCLGNPCGLQTRTVFCSDPEGNCNLEMKPVSSRQCSNITCGTWVVGNWSQCSHSCGDGYRFRKVICAEGIACNFDDEPESIDTCNEGLCPTKSLILSTPSVLDENEIHLTTVKPVDVNINKNLYSEEQSCDGVNCTVDTNNNMNKSEGYLNSNEENEDEENSSEENDESFIEEENDEDEEDEKEQSPDVDNEADDLSDTTTTEQENDVNDETTDSEDKDAENNIFENTNEIATAIANDESKDKNNNESYSEYMYEYVDSTVNNGHNKETNDIEMDELNQTAFNENDFDNFNESYEYSDDNYYEYTTDEPNLILTTTVEPEIETPAPSSHLLSDSHKNKDKQIMTTKENSKLLLSNGLQNLDKLLPLKNTDVTIETPNDAINEIKKYFYNQPKLKDFKEHLYGHHNSEKQNKEFDEMNAKIIEKHLKSLSDSTSEKVTIKHNHSENDVNTEIENEDISESQKNKSDAQQENGTEGLNRLVRVRNITEEMISEKPPDGDDILQLANNNSIFISIDEKDFLPENNSHVEEHHLQFEKPLSHGFPSPTKKPEEKYGWKVGEWSKCSVNCDGGHRNRDVMCFELWVNDVVHPKYCNLTIKPISREPCKNESCLEWQTSEWSECSTTCGHGSRIREVTCPLPHRCKHSDKPLRHQPCYYRDCAGWVTGPWSKCSVSCGGGEQVRDITCRSHGLKKSDELCETSNKPDEVQECGIEDCPQEENIRCIDKLRSSVCRSFHHMCAERLFKPLCCHTCWKLSLQKREV